MTQKRSCGTCTKCCDGWLSAHIYGQEIKPGSPCRFVASSGGCNIYANRPEVCSAFKCAWLADPQVPDWLKPEASGVIAFTSKNKKYFMLAAAGSSVSEEIQAWAEMYAEVNGLQYQEVE